MFNLGVRVYTWVVGQREQYKNEHERINNMVSFNIS